MSYGSAPVMIMVACCRIYYESKKFRLSSGFIAKTIKARRKKIKNIYF